MVGPVRVAIWTSLTSISYPVPLSVMFKGIVLPKRATLREIGIKDKMLLIEGMLNDD